MYFTEVLFTISVGLIILTVILVALTAQIQNRDFLLLATAAFFALLGGLINSASDYSELEQTAQNNYDVAAQCQEELQELKDPKVPESLVIPEVLPAILSTEAIADITKAAKECNIAKHAVINQMDSLDDFKISIIVRKCKIFKLQQELQASN